ncbi:MAG: helix-hairpin-helix domain-containing protein [Candidatus Woesebacteria bacterium]|nr:helix-hairpin-helix domain-containing protein [Candidatus Woesebacteria bacterium]
MEKLKKKYSFLINSLTSSSNQRLILFFLLGLVLIGFGIFFYKNGGLSSGDKVEVLNSSTEGGNDSLEIVVEIAGAVEKPGVYKLPNDSRIDDLLIISGGVSVNADRDWMEKYINRAAKLIDGQKVFIPNINKQINDESANSEGGIKPDQGTFGSQTSGLTNINTSTLSELDKLPGIGPVYGQSIIEHRPYSTSEELVSKGAISKSVYEKIKNLINVF